MFSRILSVVFFLLVGFGCIAAGTPDHLLKKPYSVIYYGIDSIMNRIFQYDSAKAYGEVEQLTKWAESKGDKELIYAFRLLGYKYGVRRLANGNIVKNELSGLIDELQQNGLLQLEAEAYLLSSWYYWNDPRTYNRAFEDALAAYNIYSKFSSKDFPLRSNALYDLGIDYYRFRDYPTAIVHLIDSKNTKLPGQNPHYFNIYNTIGLAYRHLEQYDSAEYYFMLAYNDVRLEKVHVWEGIICGNLGITYYLQKKYKEAIPLLEKDIAICTEGSKVSENAANSEAILGDIYLELNDRSKGMALLLDAYTKVKEGRKWNSYELMSGIFPRLAKAYAMNGNYEMGYNFSDSARRVEDSDARQKNALILAGAQQKVMAEKHFAEQQQQARERKVQILIWVFLIISIVLLMLVIFFILRNYNNQKKTNISLAKEKKRSDDLLLNILPLEVADELKATGGAVAKHFDHVTVLFTDFVNFTQAGERMTPQQLIDELHTCFKAFDEIISKHEIEKIKTIGDAYLAVAGLPAADARHAENVIDAALAIRDFMLERKKKLGEKTFGVRIGIHSGSVVAGIVGVKKFAYDIWGDTVNTAARMEQNSDSGKINISQTTYELVKDQYHCTFRGEIEAKNKGDMRMYYVDSKIAATA
jgi:adenylate cyclase